MIYDEDELIKSDDPRFSRVYTRIQVAVSMMGTLERLKLFSSFKRNHIDDILIIATDNKRLEF